MFDTEQNAAKSTAFLIRASCSITHATFASLSTEYVSAVVILKSSVNFKSQHRVNLRVRANKNYPIST